MSARSWKQLDAELAGAAPTLAYAPTPRAHLRVVIFRQIDTLLSRLVKLVKYKTRKHIRWKSGVGKKWELAAYLANSEDLFVIK